VTLKTCDHDKRFGDVFFAKNGCIACQCEAEAAAHAAILHALESSHRERDKLREELKCSHDTLCKIGGAVRFFFPDIPIAGDTVANIEAEAVKVKARIKELEAELAKAKTDRDWFQSMLARNASTQA
jgi:glutamyl/glutaminyl-tRNA synthetase